MNEMFNEYKDLFIEEAEEYITAFNDNLIAIEKNHHDGKLIDNIFRVTHTLKSSTAAVGLKELSALAHKAEDVMHKVRDGSIEICEHIIDVLFEVLDMIRNSIELIKDGKEPEYKTSPIIIKLEAIMTGAGKSAEEKKDLAVPSTVFQRLVPTEYEKTVIEEVKESGRAAYQIDIVIDPREMLKWLRAELLLNKVKTIGEVIRISPAKENFTTPSFDGQFSFIMVSALSADKIKQELSVDLIKQVAIECLTGIEKSSVVVEPEPILEKKIEVPVETTKETIGVAMEASASAVKDERKEDSAKIKVSDTIRVNTAKLDDMMNQIGELATAISGVRQIERRVRELSLDTELLNQVTFMADKLTNLSMDLQYSIMSTRMLPVSTVFNQFNRVVRDLSHKMGKKIEIVLKHEDTELDKKIIDALGEPMMHLVRNSIDHGIETPDRRLANNKPETGTITLDASRSGNHIMITVADDGNGLNIQKIKKTVIKRNLATESEVNAMTDHQITQYIFAPGFSTQDKISDVSGRGVGLDVVKTVLSALSGTVEVRSETGKGTEFILVLPLTLTTTFVILFSSGKNMYAIPVNDVKESLSVEEDQIKSVDGNRTIFLRDEVLPLISLKEVYDDQKEDSKRTRFAIVVIGYRDKKLGLIVDTIIGTDEIVLKSLDKHYKSINGLSGASILGDGRIALGIDVIGIIDLTKKNETKSDRKKRSNR